MDLDRQVPMLFTHNDPNEAPKFLGHIAKGGEGGILPLHQSGKLKELLIDVGALPMPAQRDQLQVTFS